VTVNLKLALLRIGARWSVLVLACFFALGASDRAKADYVVQPIRIAPGASSAKVAGAVIRGERALYSFAARAGQHLSLRVRAVEKNAAVQIYAPGARLEKRDYGLEVVGQPLPGAGEEDDATRWTGTLPKSGTYLLVVGPTRGNATYRLTVTIH
jgi:hypothetical protein